MRQWAAIKLYWTERRQCVEAQKAVDYAGPHGMAYVNCTAIREGYTGVGKKEVLAADAAMAAALAADAAMAAALVAIRAIRSNAIVQGNATVQGKGHSKAGASSTRAPDLVRGEAAAASVGVAGMATGKAGPAPERASGKKKGKAKAVVAHVEDDDADDFVIVKVSLANPLAKQVKKQAEQIKAKAELGSSVTAGMASAAAKAGVLWYRYAEHDDSEWANS